MKCVHYVTSAHSQQLLVRWSTILRIRIVDGILDMLNVCFLKLILENCTETGKLNITPV